ncbi:TonB-dependent receptor domain-containing protein [Novosphingobium olei]|uniref:TonB-dependent receptor n=1 Tax=Novosphingobium olei TaxID=2728851 RepID=A0A7Y0BKS3_9SPHN|nr:TonB-dependent receptor [Novosphingobium olei]NML92189.1 TonB-dependent receptor [Novosphingobium olei]
MRPWNLLLSTALFVGTASTAFAERDAAADKADKAKTSAQVAPAKTFSTGVAKGRDLLDTAISASTLDETDLPKLGVPSVAGIVANLPGIRAETSGVDGFSALTVRGLPLSADGTRYVQIQEDGLPVLEFGDIHLAGVDTFVRADIGLSQIQSIRGGSASTFASNSPGGVINLISKTGETEGGTLLVSSGLGYDLHRADFEYGAPLGEGWRFHIGGFFHEGEGPREVGYTGTRGGQIKVNLTHTFAGGYFRFYGKYLDDRQALYSLFPLQISGTNDSPKFSNLPGTDIKRDTLNSKYVSSLTGVDDQNNPTRVDLHDGIRGVSKAVGLEAQFEIGDWTVTDKFRFASNSGAYNENISLLTLPAAALVATFGGPGAVLSYVGGPNNGKPVTDLAGLNGNGLLSVPIYVHADLNNLDNVTNDLRASRTFAMGEGKLTTTAGVYYSSQNVDMYWSLTNGLEGYAAHGKGTRFDLTAADGTHITDTGILAYGFISGAPLFTYHRRYDVNYRVLAPYASANYQIGKLSIGGSLRLDTGKVSGSLYGADLGGGRNGASAIDVNGDGVISLPETQVSVLPLSRPGNVGYNYHYVSYSAGVNYRVAEPLSVFARYSRGGRAGAERLLFTPQQDPDTGKLTDSSAAYGIVKQAEAGVKLRKDGVSLFLTGFWASTGESGFQIGADADGNAKVISYSRSYSAKGLELEGEVQRGPFSLALGATYAKSKIDRDTTNPAIEGNRPRHQPSLFFSARPQFQQGMVTFGATVNGTTSSYAQDTNVLKQPGYVIVSPYLFVRPVDRLELGLTAFNAFDKLAFVNLSAAAIPALGVVNAQTLNGRTVTGSVRLSF